MNQAVNLLSWVMYFVGLYFAIFWLYQFIQRSEMFSRESQLPRRLSRYPKVSVIIPAYNAELTIKECLLSVVNLDYPKDRLEILVVNDGSTDSTGEIVAGLLSSNVRLISQGNQGKGAALNNAIKLCTGEFFACLDSDSFVEPSTLKKMLAIVEQHGPDLAIVTPAMKVYNPKSIFQKFQRVEYLIAMLFNRLLSALDALYVAPGPFSLYRTGIVRKLGGFAENNLTEDQEIGYRMQKHNYLIKHCFDGYVYTTAPSSLPQLYRQRSRWWRGSLLNFFKYKSLLLNPKYGHFGMFQLPLILLGYFTVFAVMLFFTYFTVIPWWNRFYSLYLIGFDVPTLLRSLRFSFDVLRYDFGKIFIIGLLSVFAVVMFFFAHKNARESILKYGLIYLPLYFLFYYVILSLISVIAAVQLLLGRRSDKWLGQSILKRT